jgi:ribosomal-protein-alanine N-acetyltransferase
MILTPASPAEADALAEVHARGFDHPWSAADLAALLDSPGVFALAAREDAVLRAFILARAIAGEAEILTLAVDPARRRQGIARALLEAATAAAAHAGAGVLFLEVAADNAAAIALYESAGFTQAGRRRGYYARSDGAAVDALVLRRDISP